MARVANTPKTQTSTPGRKPERPATAAAKPSAKSKSSVAAMRSAPPIEVPMSRKLRRPGTSVAAKEVGKAGRGMKAAASAPGTPSIPRVSKGELRAQVEKLELVVITLQAEGKETNRTAKAAASRIAELEDQVARLEKRAASQSAPTPATQTPVKPPRKKRRSRDIDPGDAVPPGIAVEEPAPLDEEAEAAPENLEEHLGQR
jgi:hypothetical protein